jgi:transposase InsO family protein
MKAHQAQHSISIMARVLELSKSGYYAWLRRELSRRVKANNALQRDIARIHETSRGTYGSPRVLASLRREGLAVSRKRVARQMAAMGLKGVSRRRFITTTRRGQGRPAPDLVQRRFEADAPDKLWVANITYVPTRRDWLFLAVVIDVFSRKVVGWAMDTHMRTELVAAALDMALSRRRPDGVIHHSDQGCQYTSNEFGQRCSAAGVRLSMGSVGDCYDNAMAESFFATLECELLQRTLFDDPVMARREVFAFIEGFYNTRRLHSGLAYLTPTEKEEIHS